MSDSNFLDQLSMELPVFFTRKQACEKLGGLLSPRTLANLDSMGLGCPEKKMIGGKIVYPRIEFLKWLDGRNNNKFGEV